MKLNSESWLEYSIDDIFSIINGKGITSEEIEENPGSFIAVQSGEEDNGKIGLIDYDYCVSRQYTLTTEPCLTVARSGSAGFVSYQPNGCVVGDSAKILTLKDESAKNEYVYLFLRAILSSIRYKYSYGRKVTEDKYKREIIKLPSIKPNCPDWHFMKEYIESLHHTPITTKNSSGSQRLVLKNWKEFRLGNLLSRIYKASAYNSEELTECHSDASFAIPYITRTDINNGCKCFVLKDDDFELEKGNAIIIGDTTSTVFYQEKEFICGDHIVVLRSEHFNKYTACFIVSLLRKERYRYCYGRAFLKDSIESTRLMLPVGSDGNPDWKFMETYIRNLPYGDRI